MIFFDNQTVRIVRCSNSEPDKLRICVFHSFKLVKYAINFERIMHIRYAGFCFTQQVSFQYVQFIISPLNNKENYENSSVSKISFQKY